jgi:hypothetical protein
MIKILKFDTYSVILFNGRVSLDDILKYSRFMFIYLAANALVGLLIELRFRLKFVEEKTPKSFINLIEATESIKNTIKNAAYKYRKEKLEIKIYGRRHRQNMDIIKEALNDLRGNKSHHRKVIIYLYYSNPDFLETLKSFNSDSSFAKMINEQKQLTENSMKLSINEVDAKRFDFVELKIKKHFDTPPFWAIQIDKNDIFWGYFMHDVNPDNNIEYIQGTPHKCFHFDNGTSELDGFSEWIDNIFKRLDKWSKEVV